MAEHQKGSPSREGGHGQNTHDQDTKPTCALRGFAIGCIPFVAGIALALAFGWLAYPALLFAEKEQPVAFNHQAHLLGNGMACSDCHTLRDDGSFRGLPTTAECAACHSTPQGSSPAEKHFFDEYVTQGREVPWRLHQWQPANVYFSHAAHSVESCNTCHDFAPKELCVLCHIDAAATTSAPPVFENRLTGYSRTTMKMDRCERCHAYPDHLHDTNANNACFVCHK